MGAGWQFLFIDEGDPTLARGLLIVWDGTPWLVGDGGVVTVSDGWVTTASCAVRLDPSRSAVDPRGWATRPSGSDGQATAGHRTVPDARGPPADPGHVIHAG
jgi:hypothetical protein